MTASRKIITCRLLTRIWEKGLQRFRTDILGVQAIAITEIQISSTVGNQYWTGEIGGLARESRPRKGLAQRGCLDRVERLVQHGLFKVGSPEERILDAILRTGDQI